MLYSSWFDIVSEQRAIAVIRADDLAVGLQMAKAVAAGGMRLIEITWNSDRPAELIAQLRQELPTCWIGAGTLLEVDSLQKAIAAGAQFLFSPHVNADLIHRATEHAIPIIPGALSPTEIVTAWQTGAASVKVFPVQAVGGATYIHCLQGPLGHIPLIPTGGVTLENAQPLLAAGAIAVGLSGQLFPKAAIATGDWQTVTQRAQTLMEIVRHRE